MYFKLGKYELFMGRPANNPARKSEQDYFNIFPFFSIGTKKNVIPKPNASALRNLAKNGIIRKAINLKKEGILKLDTSIVGNDAEIVKNIIYNPDNLNSYKEFWGQIIEDIIVGDCGSFEVARSGNKLKPIFLFPVDGFTIEMVTGFPSKTSYRYAQRQGQKLQYLTNDELVYIKKNTFTHTPFGFGEVEAVYTYMHYLLNAQEYADETASKAMAKFLINLGETANENSINAFRIYMENEIEGTGRIPVLGGKGVDTKQIGAINDDGLFLQYQELLISLVASIMNLPPQKLGIVKANDRSTVEQQNDNIVEEAIKPIARLLEDVINYRVIRPLGLKAEFKFIFTETEAQKKAKSERVRSEYTDGLLTQNQALEHLGYEKSTSKYADMCISEAKASINKDYEPIKPLGTNPYENK